MEPKFWDEDKKKIRNAYKGYPSIVTANNNLYRDLLEKRDIVSKLNEKGELTALSIKELSAKLNKSVTQVSFTEYTRELIHNLQKMKRYGTARAYISMMQAITKHLGTSEILFSRISYSLLKEIETAYIARGNSYNGLSAILRSLRSVFNKAIQEGIVEKENSPFIRYKIVNMPTAKRAIDPDAIKKIIQLELDPAHPCFEARNIFVLSYYFWGMNLIDLCYLQVGNFIDGRVKYERKKTHKRFDIRILPEIEPIIQFYSQGKRKEDYLIPVIKRATELERDKDVLWYRKRYNKKLRMIADMCGIQEHLTSYVSRHSFASHAESLEIPIQVISRMLGHTKLSTTEIYLKGFSSNAIDAYHDKVFQK